MNMNMQNKGPMENPMDINPFDMKPMETGPMQTAPSKMAPMQTAPMKMSPMETAPAKMAPMQTAPMKMSPMETAPAKMAPMQMNPMQMNPMQANPMEMNPMEANPMDMSPMNMKGSNVHGTMTEREALLWKVQAYEFACAEVGLFLDTHPKDKVALTYFKKYKDMKMQVEEEYAKRFGPLTMCQSDMDMSSWKWIENPWPWEIGREV